MMGKSKYYMPATVPAVVADLISRMICIDFSARFDLIQVSRHPFLMFSESV